VSAEPSETGNDAAVSQASSDSPPQYAIEGGLVIPLCVLVLSMIGGAINMTRTIPIYQREAQNLFDTQKFIHQVGEKVWNKTLGSMASLSRGHTDADVTETARAGVERAGTADLLVQHEDNRSTTGDSIEGVRGGRSELGPRAGSRL
jgi:hypothetical protein